MVESHERRIRATNARRARGSFRPIGAVEAARQWLISVLDVEDLAGVWSATDPNLRLVMAQAWTWANRRHPWLVGQDAEQVGKDLASEEGTGHPLWRAFEETQISEFRESWPPGFSADKWGVASRPRPTVVDHELVLFIDPREAPDEGQAWTEATLVHAIGVLLRRTNQGWLVAGFDTDADAGPPMATWPPSAS
jgi:hypothetical protein